jgi:Kef-type K+ transport system membrane component KefB
VVAGAAVYSAVLQRQTDLFGPGASGIICALFVGAALCITAFPTLARILQETGLSTTSLGTVAIVSGAISDVAAWVLLAITMTLCKGDPLIALWAIGGGSVFSLVVLTAGKRLFAYLDRNYENHESVSPTVLGLALLALFAGSWITDEIGVYAVFGAFIVGVAMPKGRIANGLKSQIESLTITLFLPFFFVLSGLSTKIGSLTTTNHWLIFLLMLILAIVVKIWGCTWAARISGEPKRQSILLGVLMNTRGLMELVLLNIGLQQKIITPIFFSMMVLVAVLTTMMTAPIVKYLLKDWTTESM